MGKKYLHFRSKIACRSKIGSPRSIKKVQNGAKTDAKKAKLPTAKLTRERALKSCCLLESYFENVKVKPF
jgi:hypothetical protein